MLGAIIGDIIGSTREFNGIKTKDFELFPIDSTFTDDSVLTFATAHAILNKKPFDKTYKDYYFKYPDRGFGGMFVQWTFMKDYKPYNSFGNGSAMRVSPVGWIFDNLEDTLDLAKRSAEVTHNHPEGIKGAQAVASAIFLARNKKSKEEIRQYLEQEFDYDLSLTIDEIRNTSFFNETCMISVPEAIIAFLDSDSFEDAIRNAISLGADADTQACIAGSIAEAFYDIPSDLKDMAMSYLNDDFIETLNEFNKFITQIK
jgi:ADP-ribosylglycohydrolase